MNKYSAAFINMMSSTPFFANVILNSSVSMSEKVATAGVRIKNRKIEFIFNPSFLETLTVAEVEGVIVHEILHIVFGHTDIDYRRKNPVNHKTWNIAEDCAINQYIMKDKLPKGAISVKMLEEVVGRSLDRLQTSAYYYEAIKEYQSQFDFVSTLDDHDFNQGENNESGQNLSGEEVKAIVEDLVNKALNQSNGKVPLNLEGVIASMSKGKVDWKQKFRNMIGKTAVSVTHHTRKKLNRRHGIKAPGKRKKKIIKIAICTDSSGSVSDENYALFLSETEAALNACQSEIFLIQADCEIRDVKQYKAGDKIDKKRKGYGGTAYQPAITKASELKVDLIIYAGDADCADTPIDPKIPFIWLIVGKQKPPVSFGEVIYLDDLK